MNAQRYGTGFGHKMIICERIEARIIDGEAQVLATLELDDTRIVEPDLHVSGEWLYPPVGIANEVGFIVAGQNEGAARPVDQCRDSDANHQ